MGRLLGKLCWKQENMLKKGHLLGKMAENGAFWWEKMLKMGENAPKKGISWGKMQK